MFLGGLRVDLKVGGLEMTEDAMVPKDSPRIGLLGVIGSCAEFAVGNGLVFTKPVLLDSCSDILRFSLCGKLGYHDDTVMSGVSSCRSGENGFCFMLAALDQGNLDIRYCPGDNLGSTT